MKELLEQYFETENKIQQAFGYEEQWRIFPMVDHRNFLWYLDQSESGRGSVYFSDNLSDFAEETYYQNDIYTQRHLDKWVFEAEEYTMILVETGCDSNIYLAVFENSKKIENPF